MTYIRETVDYKSANREIIRSSHLSRTHQYNKPIREALGFRELDKTKGHPTFASPVVTELYAELGRLAKTLLPKSIEEILKQWDRKEQCDNIRLLGERFGPQLWVDTLDRRDPKSNPQSQLLMRGETEFCTVDLIWGIRSHCEFILLQLEHLLFVKGLVCLRNRNYQPPMTQPAMVLKAKPPTEYNSLVHVINLAPNTLRNFPHKPISECKKRKRNSENKTYQASWRPKVANLSNTDDEEDLRMSRSTRSQGSQYSQSSPQSMRVESASKRLPLPPVAHDQTQRALSHIDIYSSPQTTVAEGSTAVGFEEAATRSPRSTIGSPFPPTPQSPRHKDHIDQAQAEAPDQKMPELKDSAGTDHEMDARRRHLNLLLIGEFSALKDVHSQSASTDNLWSKSLDLDNTLDTIWKADRARLQDDMSVKTYNETDEVVQKWLRWRALARKLGVAAGVHIQSEETSLPEYSFDEWAAKLGGEDVVDVMSYKLVSHSDEVQLVGVEKMAEQVTSAFATAIKRPRAVKQFLKGAVLFHEKLIRWEEQFANAS